jgi:(4S)-4-hydroxy-5-phosphonooxypentane-2,3-dione isomerase
MFIVHVSVRVKPGREEDFKSAVSDNARASLGEPGVARFDVVQQAADPTQFVLVEVYRSEQDAARHKETAHYAKWRDRVGEMMAEPRSSVKYSSVFPDDDGWR